MSIRTRSVVIGLHRAARRVRARTTGLAAPGNEREKSGLAGVTP
jgi:hypothetical protein